MIFRIFLLFVTLAGLAAFSLAHAQTSGCANYYTSSISVPAGYGAAYDLFNSAKELLVSVDCSGASPFFKVGSGAANQYVYNKGYLYSGSAWQSINLMSTAALVSNAWYPAAASSNLSSGIPSAWTYIVGYVCTWNGSAWKCGCGDTTCATPAWQLQAFISSTVASGGGSSNGGANGSGAGGQWAGSPDASAIVISSSGNDGNPCNVNSPCQSLGKARQVARGASDKTIYLRAGTYNVGGTLTLDGNDNGETWMTYPGDAVDSAVIDCNNGCGGGVIFLNNAGGNISNVTINGLRIQHFADWGILSGYEPPTVVGGSGIVIENCDVGFNTVTSWSSAGIAVWQSPNAVIRNNYVHDIGSMGIVLGNYSGPAGGIDGGVVENNVVLRPVQRMSDGGGIYTSMYGGDQVSRVTIKNNFVKDYGTSADGQVRGIYLDDNSSNVTVTGNVVGPPTGGSVSAGNGSITGAFLVHNGHDNHISGNILDLGDSSRSFTVLWGHDSGSIAGMNGNTFTNNTIVSNFAGSSNTNAGECQGCAYVQGVNDPASGFTIAHNTYHNYGGGEERTDGNRASDSSPIHQAPNLSGWTYTTPPQGGWGPPGFTIPTDGTPPSSPH